jgi:hypothetical protein
MSFLACFGPPLRETLPETISMERFQQMFGGSAGYRPSAADRAARDRSGILLIGSVNYEVRRSALGGLGVFAIDAIPAKSFVTRYSRMPLRY